MLRHRLRVNPFRLSVAGAGVRGVRENNIATVQDVRTGRCKRSRVVRPNQLLQQDTRNDYLLWPRFNTEVCAVVRLIGESDTAGGDNNLRAGGSVKHRFRQVAGLARTLLQKRPPLGVFRWGLELPECGSCQCGRLRNRGGALRLSGGVRASSQSSRQQTNLESSHVLSIGTSDDSRYCVATLSCGGVRRVA